VETVKIRIFAADKSINKEKVEVMINRELIRIKVVQLTYAYYQNGSKNIETAEKELLFSLSKAYDMYNYLLALIVGITHEAQRHLEVAESKAKREGTPMPSKRFVDNRFALQLEGNKMLNDFMETQKKSWNDEPEFLKKIYTQITESQIYKDYMSADEDSYQADRELWRKIYRTLIEDNADLDALLEEQSLYWNDDKEIVDSFVLKTIKRFDEKNKANQELLPEYDSEEDKDFARKLFRATIINGNEYQHYMSEASRNWDFDRLAYMDIVIMQIAIAEMLTFPSIPVNVTINEYMEIAKLYSTPRSSGYINGMLDAIAHHLVKTGRLLKQMKSESK
jgi:N utilization substance protein B